MCFIPYICLKLGPFTNVVTEYFLCGRTNKICTLLCSNAHGNRRPEKTNMYLYIRKGIEIWKNFRKKQGFALTPECIVGGGVLKIASECIKVKANKLHFRAVQHADWVSIWKHYHPTDYQISNGKQVTLTLDASSGE